MKKDTIVVTVIICLVVISAFFVLESKATSLDREVTSSGEVKNILSENNLVEDIDEVTLSGIESKLEGLGMAGAPCHVMGGQMMGDCTLREIEFEAWQYDWSEPTITVRTGELIRIKATSRDVAHGVGIPEIGFNLLIEPGKESVGEFIAPKPGTYQYGCSVMCGPGHHGHRGQLVVLE